MQIPLIPDYLEDSLLQINFTALLRNGTYIELPHIEIKPVVEGMFTIFSNTNDIVPFVNI
jgi:hypothetical protein